MLFAVCWVLSTYAKWQVSSDKVHIIHGHHDGTNIMSTSQSGVCFYGDVAEQIMEAVKSNKNLLEPKPKCHRGTPIDCGEIPKDCANGIYTIYPKSTDGFKVYCEMTVDGGGWTVFQRRENGDVNFLLTWDDYKTGFGNLNHEYWLGNTYIHKLTVQGRYELRIDLVDFDNHTAYAKYNQFFLDDLYSNFKLSLSGFSGNAGDSLIYQNGMAFSTKDRDNDLRGNQNCAIRHPGAWWYRDCMYSNLNGEYFIKAPDGDYNGIYWHTWRGQKYSLKGSTMMIRRL